MQNYQPHTNNKRFQSNFDHELIMNLKKKKSKVTLTLASINRNVTYQNWDVIHSQYRVLAGTQYENTMCNFVLCVFRKIFKS